MKKYLATAVIFFASSSGMAINTLFVGDSHSYGQFGGEIDTYLRSVSKNVVSVASCGSSPSTWMVKEERLSATNCGYWRKDIKGKEIRVKEHKAASFLKESKDLNPDLTVIALGTNILGSAAGIKSELKFVEKMVSTVKANNSQCIWIGPPNLGKDPWKSNVVLGMEQIKAVTEKAGCAFVDSSKLTKYPSSGGDGIHYGPKDSKQWGVKVVEEIKKLPQITRARDKQEQPVVEPAANESANQGSVR